MKAHSIYVDQDIYTTFSVAKYLDTATVKASKFFYNTNLPSDMTFIKADANTNADQVEKLTRELNIDYRACIGSLIYLLPTKLYLSFALHKLSRL